MSECIEITFDYDEIKTERASAILFLVNDLEIWIPKSQIIDHNEDEKQVTIPQWLAEQKGLD